MAAEAATATCSRVRGSRASLAHHTTHVHIRQLNPTLTPPLSLLSLRFPLSLRPSVKVLSLIDENTAAALQYGIDRTFDNATQTILFYNMGAKSAQVRVVCVRVVCVRVCARVCACVRARVRVCWRLVRGGFTNDHE